MLPRLYSRVPSSDKLENEGDLLSEGRTTGKQGSKAVTIFNSWCKSTMLLAVLLCFIIWDDARLRYHGSFDLGFDTEFRKLTHFAASFAKY